MNRLISTTALLACTTLLTSGVLFADTSSTETSSTTTIPASHSLTPYLGLGLVSQQATTDWSHFSDTDLPDLNFSGDSHRDTEWGLAIKGGLLLNQQHRFSLELLRVNQSVQHDIATVTDSGPTSLDHKITGLSLHYDYLHPITPQFQLLAGVHTGLVHSDLETWQGDDTTTGVYYGLQLGANYAFTPQWRAELAYRYSLTTADHTQALKDPDLTERTQVDLERLSSLSLGIHYHF